TGLRERETGAFFSEQVLDGDADVVVDDLTVTVLVVTAEDRDVADYGDAGGVDGDEDHGLLAVWWGAGVGLAHDDQNRAPRVGGTAGPPLASVDDVVVAVALDTGFDVGGIGTRDVHLGHRERRPDLP